MRKRLTSPQYAAVCRRHRWAAGLQAAASGLVLALVGVFAAPLPAAASAISGQASLFGGLGAAPTTSVPYTTPATLASTTSTLTSTTSTLTSTSSTVPPVAVGSTPELWPKLAPFKTLTVATLSGGTNDEYLAATTLEGAYNQRQGRNRLYVVWNPDDQTWLNNHVLHGARWHALQGQGSGPGGQLAAMLADYGHAIKGAIIINPSDLDTVNLATTMAGIDDAMVATPSELPLLQQYGIPVIYSFANTTFASPTAAYQWEFTHLFSQTNPADLVILNPGVPGQLRDYIVATKSFVFYLTSTNSAEEPLMNQIIAARPANTPIMGYIANEAPDVADLSSLGHFLNASDFLENGSDWAAIPSEPRLAEPTPQPVRASKNTVYVAFLVSEGDNAQYVEHHMFDVWTAGTDLGAVPEGWGMAPGMADYAPSLINWFYRHLPRDSELLAGPSGVGYATQMTGTNLQRFAQLSGGFMRKDSMSTVDFWENPTQIGAYAKASGVPSISVDAPVAYMQKGGTVVFGQTSSYVNPASTLLSTIEEQALAEPGSHPVFLEPLVDGWTYTPQDVLAISQALANWGKTVGKNFVFTTPSELALTEEAYHQGQGSGLPRLNTQAASGASLLELPSAGQVQGIIPTTVTGPNLVANPSGQDGTTGWAASAGTLGAGTFQGSPDITWSVPANPGPNAFDPYTTEQWVHVYPTVIDDNTYQFSVQVAGSGQVFMDVYSGRADYQTQAVNLSSSYRTLTWTVTIPFNALTGANAPQLQVREIGIGPVTVHMKDATVQLAPAASCAKAGSSVCTTDSAGNVNNVYNCSIVQHNSPKLPTAAMVNDCSGRIWLHELPYPNYINSSGWTYCISPMGAGDIPSPYDNPQNIQVTTVSSPC